MDKKARKAIRKGEPVYASQVYDPDTADLIQWDEVSVIIPAFNEAKTIGEVIETVKSLNPREIIVVDNNSTDHTATAAQKAEAKVVICREQGKAEAMIKGVQSTSPSTSILLFLDADLIGLKKEHITALLQPFFDPKIKTTNLMSMGTFHRGKHNEIMWKYMPFLTGQRALLKSEFSRTIEDLPVRNWEIEATLNAHFKDNKLREYPMILDGLFHVQKHHKMESSRKGKRAIAAMLAIAVIGYMKYPFRKVLRELRKVF